MRPILRYLGAVSIGIVAACGDDGTKSGPDAANVAPHLIPGGGIADGPIDGVANVYVVDDATRQPIAGATVTIGAATGTTDATGLFTAIGLHGKQSVEATAAGYGAVQWIGANGANMTIDLKPKAAATPVTVTGHVTGLSGLTVGSGHVKLAVVTYSQSDLLDDATNNFLTPNNGNVCVAVGASDSCAFTLASRTGHVALVAAILDDDTHGTPNDSSDDTQTLIGWAAHTDLDLTGDQANVDLSLLPADMLGTVTVSFGAPPAGLATVEALVGLELDASDAMQLPIVVRPAAPSLLVPTPAAVGATGYRLTGIAETDTPVPGDESVVLRRDLDGPTLEAGAWLDPASGATVTNGAAAWQPVAGATLMSVTFTMGATPELDVTVLDGSTSVVPDSATLPSGTLHAKVQALGAPGLDVTSFGLDADRDKLVQVSAVPIDVTD